MSDDDWSTVRGALAPILARLDMPTASPYAVGFQQHRGLPDVELNSQHPLALGVSPVFPRMRVDMDAIGVAVDLCFGPAFEGPPGLVHGGFLSAAFDIIVSSAAARVAPLNVTRWLRVRFLRPVSLGEKLTFSAEAQPADGRLITVEARLTDARGRTRAKAVAECVGLERSRFASRPSAVRPDENPSMA